MAYDYAERLANGVMECQVCFDSKSFFSLFMKNLIKIILKFEYTNCIIVFSIVSFLTELFPLSRKLQNSCIIAIIFKNNLGRFYYFIRILIFCCFILYIFVDIFSQAHHNIVLNLVKKKYVGLLEEQFIKYTYDQP